MKRVLVSFVMLMAISQTASAESIECPSFWKYDFAKVAVRSYESGIYLWSEGHREKCFPATEDDNPATCVTISDGYVHRIIDLRTPINFLSNCFKEDVDFCMPLNYNIPCTSGIEETAPECGA